jgi:type VI secretion system protein ImpA
MNSPVSLEVESLTVSHGMDGYLAPLADLEGASGGVGVSLRHDPVYQKIREARHQDDPTLPMREWERPLIKADWKAVAALSGDALRTRSKDFQLAAWLCEAWTHLRGVEGFAEGVRLLHGLTERFWDHAFPQLEDGDSDARVAPFMWLNQTLATVLKLQIPLLTLSIEPGSINFDAWSRIAGRASNEDNPGELNREFLDGEVSKGTNLADLARLEEQVGMALDAIASLERGLDMRLGNEAPSFSRVLEALMDLKRAARSLRGERALPVVAETPVAAAVAVESVVTNVAPADTDGFVVEQHAQGVTDTTSVMTPFRIADRAHAYELLDAVAQYLARSEPHSPTPYLLKRAVAWGAMPLPELMREIVNQEGDLSRYFAMLGLHNE